MQVKNYELKKAFYETLTEVQKRQFAAIICEELPHGGQVAICSLFNISHVTVNKGLKELKSGDFPDKNRIRREGGGRKKKDR